MQLTPTNYDRYANSQIKVHSSSDIILNYGLCFMIPTVALYHLYLNMFKPFPPGPTTTLGNTLCVLAVPKLDLSPIICIRWGANPLTAYPKVVRKPTFPFF